MALLQALFLVFLLAFSADYINARVSADDSAARDQAISSLINLATLMAVWLIATAAAVRLIGPKQRMLFSTGFVGITVASAFVAQDWFNTSEARHSIGWFVLILTAAIGGLIWAEVGQRRRATLQPLNDGDNHPLWLHIAYWISQFAFVLTVAIVFVAWVMEIDEYGNGTFPPSYAYSIKSVSEWWAAISVGAVAAVLLLVSVLRLPPLKSRMAGSVVAIIASLAILEIIRDSLWAYAWAGFAVVFALAAEIVRHWGAIKGAPGWLASRASALPRWVPATVAGAAVIAGAGYWLTLEGSLLGPPAPQQLPQVAEVKLKQASSFLAIGRGGNILAGAMDEGLVEIDAATGEIIGRLVGDGFPVDLHVAHGKEQFLVRKNYQWTIKGRGESKTIALEGESDWDAVFSSDGRWVASSRDTANFDDPDPIMVWDAATGKLRGKRLEGHKKRVHIFGIAISHDGNRLASVALDETLRVWDLTSGAEIYSFPVAASRIAFSLDDRKLFTGLSDGKIVVRDSATGQETSVLGGHSDNPTSFAFSKDGKLLLSASMDGTARIWDIGSGRCLGLMVHGTGWVNRAVFTADGNRAVTIGDDNAVKIWDISGLASVAPAAANPTLPAGADTPPAPKDKPSAEPAPPNLKTAGASQEPPPRLLYGHRQDYINDLSFSPKGDRILSASNDATARVWDVVTGKPALELKHEKAVIGARFNPSGDRVVTGEISGKARTWNAVTGEQDSKICAGSGGSVVKLSKDGSTILATYMDNNIWLWSWDCSERLIPLDQRPLDAEFSPDDSRIAVTLPGDGSGESRFPDGGVLVVDAKAAATVFAVEIKGPLRVVYSPDGKLLAVSTWENGAFLLDANGGRQIAQLGSGEVRAVHFSPDGKRLLVGGEQAVTVWDVDTKKPKRTLVHDVNVHAATFSPDGKQIATGDKEGRIRIWASEGGETVSIATPGRVEGRYVEPACDEVTGGVAVARARWIYTNSDGTQELQLSLLCRKKGSGPYVPQGVLASTQYAEAPKLRKISPEQLKLAVATTEHMGWKASPEDLAFYGEKYPDSNSLNKEPVSIRILVDQARAGKALDVMLRLPGLSDLDAAFAEAQQQARKAGAYAN